MNVLNNLKFEPYGYSHGTCIGFKLYGIDCGVQINFDLIDQLLVKRKGNIKYNTSRSESERYEIKSGIEEGVTTGACIWLEIPQSNFRSTDYDFGLVRPGHADLSAYQKYGSDFKYQGGGQFSGRLTVLYVIAGEIARQVLHSMTTINIFGHVKQVGKYIDNVSDISHIIDVQTDPFPMVDQEVKTKALHYLDDLKKAGDSVGGKLDIYIDDFKTNYGDDFFASLESKISFFMFSIPAVKAIEFGIGTQFANARGSDVIEQLEVDAGKVMSHTNYNGGINGGIANLAAPIKLSLIVKPTSSIFMDIDTVKYIDGQFEPAKLKLSGRHDSFIANRALWPSIGLLYILFLDLEMENNVR